MQPTSNIFIGIDVSKSELVTAYQQEGKWVKSKVPNRLNEISIWLNQIGMEGKHFILEATGPYSERLIHALATQDATYYVVNPTQSRSMSKVLCKTNKNDDQDAQTLSILGQRLELRPHKMPDEAEKRRKEAFSVLVSLQKMEGQLKNQIHAFEYRVMPNEVALNALKTTLSTVEEQITTLEKELKPQKTETEQIELINRIKSIKSVGKTTATAFVTLFGDFSNFTNAKAFVKFIGLSPTEYTSGSSVRGRKGITKKGSGKIRALLFNCARSAIRFNQNCKEFYERLCKKDKNGKVALTAVMHKLARLIFGVVRSGVNYDPNFISLKTEKILNSLPS